VQAAAAPATAAPGREERYVVRRGERAAIDIEGGVRWERLTPAAMDEVEFLELVYEPHAESNAGLYRHPGTEMVLVLSGRLDIFVAFERYELGPGDSIAFPSTTPHRYLNPTDQTTRAVTVILADGEQRPWNQTRRP
jgi:quercetin dioxygenase-like cupin family protein